MPVSLHKLFDRVIVLLLATSLLFSLTGCSRHQPQPPFPTDLQKSLQTQKVALIPGRIPIGRDVELFAKSKTFGAGKGAGHGALKGLGYWAYGMTAMVELDETFHSNLLAPLWFLMLPIAVAGGGTAGAIWGGVKGTPEKVTKAIASRLENILRDLDPQQELCQKVFKYSEEKAWLNVAYVELADLGDDIGLVKEKFKDLESQNFGTVLEITLVGIELSGGEGSNPELAWHLSAVARLVSLNGSNAFYQRDFEYLSSSKRFSEINGQDAAEIRADLTAAFDGLARVIFDRLFIAPEGLLNLYFLWPSGLKKGDCCWHCPRTPPLDYSSEKGELEYPQMLSIVPILAWYEFPDEIESQLIREKTRGEVSDVCYDLRVWRVEGHHQELVYERFGLKLPFHVLEKSLQPDSSYFWSVRSCFQLEGLRTCTPWAYWASPGSTCSASSIPFGNYYRFRTPGKTASEVLMEERN